MWSKRSLHWPGPHKISGCPGGTWEGCGGRDGPSLQWREARSWRRTEEGEGGDGVESWTCRRGRST